MSGQLVSPSPAPGPLPLVRPLLVLEMSLDPISVWIDDRDSRVRFNGDWVIGGIPANFNGTESSSTRVGDSFVVPFYGMYQQSHHNLQREKTLSSSVI